MFSGFYFCFQVAGLFRDPSIGNAINIVVVRLILLEQDEVKSCLFMSSVSSYVVCLIYKSRE